MEEPDRKLRIVIACGGTGGHLFPGIAVAQAAHVRGHEPLVLISEKQIDALATEGHGDLRFEKVPAIARPPLLSLRMVKFGWKLLSTIRQCRRILTSFNADVVLGMGGFTSLPPLYAGRKKKLRTLLHESNAIPGKANLLSAKYCDLVLLGLKDCASHFPAGKTRVVGTPLREALRHPANPAKAYEFFGLDPARKTVLVMGGSQGARGINENTCAALPHLDPAAVQIIHLTGPTEIEAAKKAYALHSVPAHVAPFCQRMELAYSIATMAVSRSGGSSLSELSAFGIPTILIPYPFAADDHQTRNAEVFVRAEAAVMVRESDLTGARMAALISDLCSKEDARRSLSEAMRGLGAVDAAERVCAAVEELAFQRPPANGRH